MGWRYVMAVCFFQCLFRLTHVHDLACQVGAAQIVSLCTSQLPQFYMRCNPQFSFSDSRNPRRILTKPSERKDNDGFDNENSDLILCVHDVLQADTAERCTTCADAANAASDYGVSDMTD